MGRRFSDVSLLCERVGVTYLPMAQMKGASRSESMTELGGKRDRSSMGRKGHASVKVRNLYRVSLPFNRRSESAES